MMNRPAPTQPHQKRGANKPSRLRKPFTIVALALACISILPFLGFLSIPALVFAIVALVYKEPQKLALVALVLASVSILTSPTVWMLSSYRIWEDVTKQWQMEFNDTKTLADICDQSIHFRSSVSMGEQTCKLNGVEVDCDIYETYDAGDIIRCNEAKTTLLPSSGVPKPDKTKTKQPKEFKHI